jgi:hypothetical protein
MSKIGSMDFDKKGGMCVNCQCCSLWYGCIYQNDMWKAEGDSVVFGEQPGPGLHCIFALFPPMAYIMLASRCCYTVSTVGMSFALVNGPSVRTRSVKGKIYCKYLFSEEPVIEVDNVVNIMHKQIERIIVRHGTGSKDITHRYLYEFTIYYLDVDGSLKSVKTKIINREGAADDSAEYTYFARAVRALIVKGDPSLAVYGTEDKPPTDPKVTQVMDRGDDAVSSTAGLIPVSPSTAISPSGNKVAPYDGRSSY